MVFGLLRRTRSVGFCVDCIWHGYSPSKSICGICGFAENPATPLEPMVFNGFQIVAADPISWVLCGMDSARLFPFQIDLRDLRICGKSRNTSRTNGFQWFPDCCGGPDQLGFVWNGFGTVISLPNRFAGFADLREIPQHL